MDELIPDHLLYDRNMVRLDVHVIYLDTKYFMRFLLQWLH